MSISISLLHSVSNLTGEQTPRTHPCCEVRERLKQNMDAYRQLWAGIRKSTSSSSSVGPPVWCPPKIKHLSGTQRHSSSDFEMKDIQKAKVGMSSDRIKSLSCTCVLPSRNRLSIDTAPLSRKSSDNEPAHEHQAEPLFKHR